MRTCLAANVLPGELVDSIRQLLLVAPMDRHGRGVDVLAFVDLVQEVGVDVDPDGDATLLQPHLRTDARVRFVHRVIDTAVRSSPERYATITPTHREPSTGSDHYS